MRFRKLKRSEHLIAIQSNSIAHKRCNNRMSWQRQSVSLLSAIFLKWKKAKNHDEEKNVQKEDREY